MPEGVVRNSSVVDLYVVVSSSTALVSSSVWVVSVISVGGPAVVAGTVNVSSVVKTAPG